MYLCCSSCRKLHIAFWPELNLSIFLLPILPDLHSELRSVTLTSPLIPRTPLSLPLYLPRWSSEWIVRPWRSSTSIMIWTRETCSSLMSTGRVICLTRLKWSIHHSHRRISSIKPIESWVTTRSGWWRECGKVSGRRMITRMRDVEAVRSCRG